LSFSAPGCLTLLGKGYSTKEGKKQIKKGFFYRRGVGNDPEPRWVRGKQRDFRYFDKLSTSFAIFDFRFEIRRVNYVLRPDPSAALPPSPRLRRAGRMTTGGWTSGDDEGRAKRDVYRLYCLIFLYSVLTPIVRIFAGFSGLPADL